MFVYYFHDLWQKPDGRTDGPTDRCVAEPRVTNFAPKSVGALFNDVVAASERGVN
jgi:hypothetical protein